MFYNNVGQLQNEKTRAIFRFILWLSSMLLSLKLLPSPAISHMRRRQDNVDNYRIAKSKGSLGDRGKNKQTNVGFCQESTWNKCIFLLLYAKGVHLKNCLEFSSGIS